MDLLEARGFCDGVDVMYICVFVCREKVELVDDIKDKQELVQQRKVELEDLQTGVSSATDQREKLERDREEARRLLEHLDAEVRAWQLHMWVWLSV